MAETRIVVKAVFGAAFTTIATSTTSAAFTASATSTTISQQSRATDRLVGITRDRSARRHLAFLDRPLPL